MFTNNMKTRCEKKKEHRCKNVPELESNPGPASYILWDFAQSRCSITLIIQLSHLSLSHPSLALFLLSILSLLWIQSFEIKPLALKIHTQNTRIVYCIDKECYFRGHTHNLK